MADWGRLVAGGFAYMDASFAVHPKDRERALLYMQEALAAGLSWHEVERQLIAYMHNQRMTPETIDKNLLLAAGLMKEWFE
ncbi:hypothetical protein [Mesorhizobium sp. M4B.F.Ca.ET.049.02.1.2]|uniref:hypothetical protein n=1 Tax=Mesorhizobium sp. M4B.F.Ca.ET.049.02.1.2 TaxID=2496752 RepID=UPI000FCB34A2|nr:hypothetical protein [Mesorhizobium sp. M4B.F.Ca.ET.049.02.1.2]RUW59176.1 hypothetical protein EOA31_37435 [Mesorhizobium sp. M4B.F.Ca.ET.049.02.1.2]